MKRIDIINNIDRTTKESWVCLEAIAKEFDIFDYLDGNQTKLQSYEFQKWLCTDSWVGSRHIF